MATRPVRLSDIGSLDGAFVSNARGIAAVSQIDDRRFELPFNRADALIDAYEQLPWDAI